MSKYIIRNCPALFDNFCHSVSRGGTCKDCTDCLLKQVVEMCKNEVICDDCELQGTNKCDARMCTNFYLNDFAEQILQLFEIEECE